MPTLKQRISLCPDARVLKTIERLAKLRGEPVATVSLDLIERALELEEDLHFSRVADQRIEANEARVSHRHAWK